MWLHLESPLDSKEIKLVNPKGNQPWIFIGRINAEAETPILWPPDTKSWCIGKASDAGKDWEQVAKEVAEDEMVGRHHWLNCPEFKQTLGNSEGQGSLACCSPWDHKEFDTTEQLNWAELNQVILTIQQFKHSYKYNQGGEDLYVENYKTLTK